MAMGNNSIHDLGINLFAVSCHTIRSCQVSHPGSLSAVLCALKVHAQDLSKVMGQSVVSDTGIQMLGFKCSID